MLHRLLILLIVTAAAATMPSPVAAAPPAEDLYTYDVRFDLDVTYLHQTTFGNENGTSDRLAAEVTGVLRGVGLSTRRVRPNTDGTALVSGEATTLTSTDDGRHSSSCRGDDVRDHTGLRPRIAARAGDGPVSFYPYFSLYAVMACSSTTDPQYEDLFQLEPTVVPVSIPTGRAGERRISVPVRRVLPEQECPGSDESGTSACIYRITGTFVLTRQAGPPPYVQPTQARLDQRGRASLGVGCRLACTARVTVHPLRGDRVLGKATQRLRPRQSARVGVRLSAAQQRVAARSGGVWFVTTYVAPGEPASTFVTRLRR